MVTNLEIEYLNGILQLFPTNNPFRISDLIRSLFDEPFTYFFTSPDNQEAEVIRASNELTAFLIANDLATYGKDPFFDRPRDSRELIITDKGKALAQCETYQNYAKDRLQEQNQLQRLDWVLDFFATHAIQGRGLEDSWNEIKKRHPTIHVEFLESYRKQMIDKLLKDDYIEPIGTGVYRATWEGALFSAGGGYMLDFNKKNEEKIRITKIEEDTRKDRSITRWLTGIIAFGTAFSVFYYIQEVDDLNWLYSFNVMVSLWVFLFGILAGLMIWLIIKELKSKS